MKKSRYSEEQIIGILKQHEAGVKTADLRREHGISEATFYNWKSKYGGLGVSEFFPAFDCRPVRPSILEPAVLLQIGSSMRHSRVRMQLIWTCRTHLLARPAIVNNWLIP